VSFSAIVNFIDQFEVFIILAILLALVTLKSRIFKWLRRDLGIDELRLETLRTRILLNIHNTPFKAEVIEEDFEEYQQLGGNGYMNGVMIEWRAGYEHGIIAKRIGTWDGIDRRQNNRKVL
jgi:hypothetical protein